MKQIGLSVCYDTKNFGSQLQVLATIKKIEELGYKTEIIRYCKTITPKFVLQTIPRFFNPCFLKTKFGSNHRNKELQKHPELLQQVKRRNKRFNQFAETHFTNMSSPYRGWETLCEQAGLKYDAFLCGSDQLWLPSNLGSHFYTLEYAPANKPKIAYATSFGVSRIPWFQKKSTARYLNRFSALSSREEKGTAIIKGLTGKDVPVVCDPTLLLSYDEWTKLIPSKRLIEDKYIFCYFLGTNLEHRKIARELRAKTGLSIVSVPFLDNYVDEDRTFGDVRLFDMDSGDFVNLIRNAEYVLTDSFHGSVFSILNHKQFITLNRFADENKNSRNSRIETLCSILALEDRRYKNADICEQINAEIDYDSVEDRLSELRSKSAEYLSKALKGENGNVS